MSETEPRVCRNDLDRLVEGELTALERRRLIAQLDAQPDGWKRCGLAFLEAQSWRQALGAVTETPAPAAPPAPNKTAANSGRGAGARWAIAAAVLIAFVLGVGAGRQTSAPVMVQRAAPAGDLAERDTSPETAPAANESAGSPRLLDSQIRLVGTVTLDGGDGPRTVPVVSGAGLDESWLRRNPAPLSDYTQRRLARNGWSVDQQRRLVRVDLADGGRVTIPIDSVRYRYVGQRVY